MEETAETTEPGELGLRLEARRLLEKSRSRICSVLSERGNGSFMRGWRSEFDPPGNLEIDFADYCTAAARLNFSSRFSTVNSPLLFGLDGQNETMTLTELAPEEGELVDKFKAWISCQFGSTRDMFEAFDEAGTGKLSLEDFIEAGIRIGFTASRRELEQLYECCDYGQIGFLRADDVIFLEEDQKVRAQESFKVRVCALDRWRHLAAQEHIKLKSSKAKAYSKARTAPRLWWDRTFELLPAVSLQAKYQRERDLKQVASKARAEFMTQLCTVFGNELRGFRRTLSQEGSYCVSQEALKKYIRGQNLRMNPIHLWRGIDRDGDGVVRLEDFSPQHAFALAALKSWACREPFLGNCAAIWRTSEAADVSRERSGAWFSGKKMLTGIFLETLRRLQWPQVRDPETRRLVTEGLDLHGCGVISKGDLEWLDKWHPTEWVYAEPDHQALADFKKLLVRTYGHMISAWRRVLDKDNSNFISWCEFRKAADRLGFNRTPGAWRALDVNLDGYITMTQYDRPSAELLRSFKDWAEAQFGSVKRCFKQLDTDASGNVTLAEMKRACHKLHWAGDVALLFQCLESGKPRKEVKKSISYNEIEFLDKIQLDQDEAVRDVAAGAAQSRIRRSSRAQDCEAVTKRLTKPMGWPLKSWTLANPGVEPPEFSSWVGTEEAMPTMDLLPDLPAKMSMTHEGGLTRSRSWAGTAQAQPPRERGRGDAQLSQRVDALMGWNQTWG